MRTFALPLTAVALTLGLAACGGAGEQTTDAATDPATADMSDTTAADPALAGDGTASGTAAGDATVSMDTTGSGNMAGATTGGPAATGSGAASHNQVGTSGASGTVATTASDAASETSTGPTTPGETSGKAPIEKN